MESARVTKNIDVSLAQSGVQSMQATLSCSVTAVLYSIVVPIPDWVSVVRLYPTIGIRYALNELPVAIGGSTVTAAFTIGAVCNSAEWQNISMTQGASRQLQLTCTSTGSIVQIVIF